jgi:hypothetical protein
MDAIRGFFISLLNFGSSVAPRSDRLVLRDGRKVTAL